MKIGKVNCWVLQLPLKYPLIKETSYPRLNFVEIETDDGLKGHAMTEYPMAFGIKDFINREVSPRFPGWIPRGSKNPVPLCI